MNFTPPQLPALIAALLALISFTSPTLLAQNTQPTQSSLLNQYAKAHLALQQSTPQSKKNALTTLTSLQKKDPHSYHLASKLSNTHWHHGSRSQASTTLQNFAKTHPQNLPAQLRYTNFLRAVSPRDEIARQLSIKTLQTAIANHGLTPHLFTQLLSRHELGQERAKSIALYQKFTQLPADSPQRNDPHHWQAHLNAARTLFPNDSPNFATANELTHQQLHRTALKNKNVARQISEYYRKKSNLPQAITTLQEHLQLTPSSHSLRTRLGILQLASNDPQTSQQGEATLLQNLLIDPRQPLAHKTLAKHYGKTQQNEQRLHHRIEALKVGPGVPSEFLDLAQELLLTEQPQHTHNARLLLEKARFDHPTDVEILVRLAIATARENNETSAQTASRLFRQAETLAAEKPEDEQEEIQALLDADFQLEFATILLNANSPAAEQTAHNRKLAEGRLRKAIRSIPSDQPQKSARALCALAQLWLDQNKNQAAAHALLRRAKQQDPENKHITTLLERLKK